MNNSTAISIGTTGDHRTRTVRVTGNQLPTYYLGRHRELWVTMTSLPVQPVLAPAA